MNRVPSEHRRFAAALSTAAALYLFLFPAHAVILEWDANSETNLAGYRVYMGRQSRVYDSVLDVTNQTMAQVATIFRTTFFAVTAYDNDGLESDFSDEVFYVSPAPNSPPVALADQYVMTRNTPLQVAASGGLLANDSDADGDALIVVLETSLTHGTLLLNANGSFTYTPTPNFTGTDSFSYRSSDGAATSAVAIVTITVNATPNSVPLALSDQYTGTQDVPLNISSLEGVFANDVDTDGDPLVALLVNAAGHGSLVLGADGSFSYTPAPGFAGIDSFSYRATDGRATSAVASVTLVVNQNPPSTLNCLECFAELDAVLMARSNVFPGVIAARFSVPTNVTCPQAGVLVFEAVTASMAGIVDAEIRSALAGVADCLMGNLQSESTLRLAAASDLSPSKWTTAASNQVAGARRILERARGTTNEVIRGRLFKSVTASLLRTDRLIASGNLAPTTLTNRRMVCKILGQGATPLLTFSFDATSCVVAQTTNGTPVTVGTYSYARTRWNSGVLVLTFDQQIFGHGAGETVTTELKFAGARHRIAGAFRGYFTFE